MLLIQRSRKSFINIMNRRGPQIDPRGTPLVTGGISDNFELQRTASCLCSRYDFSNARRFAPTPNLRNLCNNNEYVILSKALKKLR